MIQQQIKTARLYLGPDFTLGQTLPWTRLYLGEFAPSPYVQGTAPVQETGVVAHNATKAQHKGTIGHRDR